MDDTIHWRQCLYYKIKLWQMPTCWGNAKEQELKKAQESEVASETGQRDWEREKETDRGRESEKER